MDRGDELQDWLDSRADEMAELVERLVAIDSENPPGRRLGECGAVLRDAVDRLGLPPELIDLPASGDLEGPCIVRSVVGDGPGTLYFHGHFDVVPAQRRDQFEPQRHDGKIFGRGSADMKGGLVSMIYGAAAAREFGFLDGRGQIVLHFVCDEETGSAVGAGHLRDAEMIDPDALAMLTAEPTGGVIWHASRGAITLRVSVRGREAHVGQAHLGINAFERMIQVAQPLTELADDLLARGSMLVVGGSAEAGASFNVVPGSAWFSLDRRFNPEEDLDEELDRLTGMVTDAAAAVDADVVIDVLQSQPSGSTEPTHPAGVTLGECIADVEGAEPRFEMCPGSLETRWYAQLGDPVVCLRRGASRCLARTRRVHRRSLDAALRRSLCPVC